MIDYFKKLKRAIDNLNEYDIENVVDELKACKERENTVYVIGNGGSASTAEHLVNDFIKFGRIKAFALTNLAIITAIGNDLGYDNVFVEQLAGLLEKGDLVIAISGSGNSENITKALVSSMNNGTKCIGLLGMDGGHAKEYCDLVIRINSNDYGIIEDLHLSVGHYLSRRIT